MTKNKVVKQDYKLLGTLFSACSLNDIVHALVQQGWQRLTPDEECERLSFNGLNLRCEGQGSMLLELTFSGEVDSVQPFFNCIDTLPVSYSLDLFGDSARLVRRFIR